MTDLRDDKVAGGTAEVLQMAWPAGLTMLNSVLMRFVDGLMVSRVGPAAFSAQLVAGMLAFVPESFATGVLTVVNTYVSQNLGARQLHRCGRYAWAGLLLAAAFALTAAPLAAVARPLFTLIGHGPELSGLETTYFRYMLAAIFPCLTARVMQQFFFGIHRPRVVLVASLIANLFNVAANYVLIFGKLGLPALGLEGAAIGTLMSWCLLMGIMASVFFSRDIHRSFATRSRRSVGWRQCRDLLKVGYPPGLQFANDVLSWSIFVSVLVGAFGPIHLTACTAAMRWMPLSFMPAVGIGIATTALVGRYIGEGSPDVARRRAHLALRLALAYMGLCAAAFWLFRRPMVAIFVKIDPSAELTGAQAAEQAAEIVRIGGWIMICAAVFQLFDAMAIVYIGALRGAGDTFWPMVATIVLSWLVIVGGGYAMVCFLPHLKSIGPWIAAATYVILLGVLMAWRFESGAWRRIDLLGRAAEGRNP